MPTSEARSIADKLKKYSSIFNEHEVKSFLQLADEHEEHHEGEEHHKGGRKGTLAERVAAVLEDLEHNLHESLDNLKNNEIAASWELAGW